MRRRTIGRSINIIDGTTAFAGFALRFRTGLAGSGSRVAAAGAGRQISLAGIDGFLIFDGIAAGSTALAFEITGRNGRCRIIIPRASIAAKAVPFRIAAQLVRIQLPARAAGRNIAAVFRMAGLFIIVLAGFINFLAVRTFFSRVLRDCTIFGFGIIAVFFAPLCCVAFEIMVVIRAIFLGVIIRAASGGIITESEILA